ncbi:MAG: GNAT family N-acetyltransferase [Lachnospiraceae bacterium]|nr:GNAT family N-acetyltransferase [Lachnospiraceae bacterium]
MMFRKAKGTDANQLKTLYFEYLTHFPPKEEQDMSLWQSLLEKFEKDENMYLLVAEEDGKVVSSVQMAIIEGLTHNVRPFAVIENVVTHADYRNRGLASALLEKASEIARERRCYKVFLETGSNKESTLNFYRNNGFAIDEKHSCLKRL